MKSEVGGVPNNVNEQSSDTISISDIFDQVAVDMKMDRAKFNKFVDAFMKANITTFS